MGARTVAICHATASVQNKNKGSERETIKFLKKKKILYILKVSGVL